VVRIYFDELLARIWDIRSLEKVFWRKVLDIYATSIDRDPGVEASQRFFAAVQNKMHWAAHGKTAAAAIVERADASKPNMGLTSWLRKCRRTRDVAVGSPPARSRGYPGTSGGQASVSFEQEKGFEPSTSTLARES
jgi:hypothetical protein